MKKSAKKFLGASLLGLGVLAMAQAVDARASEVEEVTVETGSVLVTYMDEYGQLLAGQATGSQEASVTTAGILDEDQVPVGTPYDTSEHKPSTITTEAGKLYYLIDYEYTNGLLEVSQGVNTKYDAEKGTVQAGTTVVTYVYSTEKREGYQDNQWDQPIKQEEKTIQEPVQKPEVKKLRVPAGNNGVKTRVPVKQNQSKKSEVKKLRVPTGNNGVKTRVPVKKTQAPQVQTPATVEDNAIPNNEL